MRKQKIHFWNRLEFRLILIIIFTTIATSLSFYIVEYNQFHNLILNNLKDDALTVNEYIAKRIDPDSFTNLNTLQDEDTILYIKTKNELNNIRQIANIRYLYTAKRAENGELIYIVDGLDHRILFEMNLVQTKIKIQRGAILFMQYTVFTDNLSKHVGSA